MSLISFLTIITVSVFFGNLLLTKWFIDFAKKRDIYDVPISRSSHTKVTPRGGGVGFVSISLFTLLCLLIFYDMPKPVTHNGIYLIAALTGMSLLGWFDDMESLMKRIRFSVQIICGLTILLGIGTLTIFYIPLIVTMKAGFVGTFLGLIWIAGTTNIYNFMDGVDGIASLQGVIAAISWAILGWMIEFELLVIMNVVIIATVLAFLRYNWSPARIFMGDVGSVFLGFWFASMPFLAAFQSPDMMIGDTVWFGAIVLWPFLFDGTFTIARRFKNGKNILEAHRSHLYQRLNIAGYSHKYIAALYSSFAIGSSLTAFLFLHGTEIARFFLVVVLFLLSMGYVLFVTKVEERNAQTIHN